MSWGSWRIFRIHSRTATQCNKLLLFTHEIRRQNNDIKWVCSGCILWRSDQNQQRDRRPRSSRSQLVRCEWAARPEFGRSGQFGHGQRHYILILGASRSLATSELRARGAGSPISLQLAFAGSRDVKRGRWEQRREHVLRYLRAVYMFF